jgi:hypothetical protein
MTAATSLRLAGDFKGAENYYKLAISLRPQVSVQSRPWRTSHFENDEMNVNDVL